MRLNSTIIILVSVAVATPALAQQSPDAGARRIKRVATSPVSRPNRPESIVVTARTGPINGANGVTGAGLGAGLLSREDAPKAESRVSADYIQKQAPGTSALQLVRLVPGATVGGSDPFGLSDQSTISVRGLNQDEIGYVMEGYPLNDSGIYIQDASEWADSENISSVTLAQGAAGLTDPVYTAAGGVMTVDVRDPSMKFGGLVDATYGNYDTNREFIRLDSGMIGNSGVRGFVSFSDTTAKNSHGPGRNHRRHVDFKLLKEWGQNRVSIFGSYNSRDVAYYEEPTLSEWNELGRSANYAGTFVPGQANYWKSFIGGWNDVILSAPSRFAITDNLQLTAAPYFYWGSGYYPGGTLVNEQANYIGTEYRPENLNVPGATNGQFNALGQYLEQEYSAGVNAALHYKAGNNNLTLGYWYSYQTNDQQQPFAALGPTGEAANSRGGYSVKYADGTELLAGDNHALTQINEIYLGDTLSLDHDRLQFSAGFKEMMFDRAGRNYLPGPQYASNQNTAQPLPQVSISYRPDKQNQIFVSGSGNFRPPSLSNLFDSYNITTGALTGVANGSLKDEYSIEEEAGYRYQGRIVGSLTFFNYNFTNHQTSTVIDENGSLISSYINTGGQTSRGFDAEIGTAPIHYISPYVSVEYLNATTDNNLQVGSDLLPTAGKTAVRSPRWQAAAGLAYDDGTFFANSYLKYTGSQYSTFVDDQQIPSFVTGDVTLGVRLRGYSALRAPTFRLNFINVGDARFLSGIAAPTANAQTMKGIYGTTIAGSSPTYFVGAGFALLGTIQTSF